MEHYDLSKTYEFEGHWWIANTTDKFPGKLALSPNGIRLNVYGPRDQLVAWSGYDEQKKGRIIGQSINGTLITLNRAFNDGHTDHSHADKTKEEYSHSQIVANQCFIGQHILDGDAVVDADFYINFPHLEKWFEFNPYNTKHDFKNSTHSCSIQSSAQLIGTEIPFLKSHLGSFHSVTLPHGSFEKFHSDCIAYLFLKAGHPISAAGAMETAHQITNLWSLFAGAYIAPRYVFFRKITEISGQIESYEFNIYVPLSDHNYLDKVDWRDMLADYPSIKNDIGKIFNKWFADAEQMKAVRALYFKSFKPNRQRYYSVEQFLNYMAALEILSRDCGASSYLSKEQRKQLSSQIIKLVTENIAEPNIQEKVSSNIHKIFAPTLRENLLLLAQTLEPTTVSAFPILTETEIGRLVNTRNFYTHYGDISPKGIFSENELFKVIDQLMLLVMVLLLKPLGIAETTLMERFKKIWDYHFALKWQ